jgi:hypothetical protein
MMILMRMMMRNAVIVLNATVVQSIAMIAIAVMTVAIAGILMQVYAWQTLMHLRLKSN